MATKLRNLGTSAITKAILWAVFAAFSFFTIMGFVSVYHVADKNDLPSESLTTYDYTESQDFMLYKRDIIASLYWGYPPEKLYGYDRSPTLYYRGERADGSVSTNVPNADADWFKQHRSFGIYRTEPYGDWEVLAQSDERRQMGGSSIGYGQVQIFDDDSHGYSGSHRSTGYSRYDNTYMLPLPKDTPEAVLRQLYGDSYEETVSYSYGGITVRGRTKAPTSGASAPEPPYEDFDGTEYADVGQVDEYLNDEEIYAAWLLENPIPQATVYYAFDDASLAAYESFWQQSREYYVSQFVLIGGLALVALVAAIWLLIVCGRRPADREIHLAFIDRAWSEAILGAGALTVFGFFGLFAVGLGLLINNQMYADSMMFTLYCGGLVVLAVLTLIIMLSLTRLLKAKRLIRNSLTFKFCYWCWVPVRRCIDALRSCFDERSFKGTPLTKALQKRQMVFFGVLGTMLLFLMLISLVSNSEALFVLLLICTAAIAAIAYWHWKGNIKTYAEINAGFSDSFDEQMKSERTKTALITNVSHDLKTPLTSIITYVDLLSKEDLSDTARDYVAVLAQKSERLKSIVADLFDLSKSASGNIPLDMETLDLKRLIDQTIADMRDNIDASELVLKTKLPEGEVNIYSDGKKLYRVFQNIIDNALKYSMSGTRVFITLETEDGRAVATVKNTAAYEMDFTAEEVLQRFSRGDSSRSGDGSGLGLSIAESFTGACGGDFKVEIDGDLFKVTISFKVQ